MSKRSVLKTAPADVPLTLAEAKVQLKLEQNFVDDDALITTIIDGVTDQAQDYLQRQLMQATWQVYLDSWNDLDCNINRSDWQRKELSGVYLVFPKNPVVSLTSIKYLDTNGVLQSLNISAYQFEEFGSNSNVPARIRFTGDLPALQDTLNAVVIEYVAGYGAAGAAVSAQQAAIKSKFKLWIKAQLGSLYQNRQTIIASGKVDTINEYMLGLLSADRLYL